MQENSKSSLTKFNKFLYLPVIFIILVPLIKADPEEYLGEFNNSGETCTISGYWNYLDLNKTERYIIDYKCCYQNCLDLIYDTKNNHIFNENELLDVSKLVILNSKIEFGSIEESDYTIEEKSESITCSFYGLDVFKKESVNLGAKVTSEKLAPELMPKKVANLIKRLYEVSKDIGLVKNVNPAGLTVSTLCVGSNLFESVAISSLESCRTYIINVKNHVAYDGMTDDLLNCHNESLNKLKIAKYNPDILIKSLEQSTWGKIKCFFNSSKSCENAETDYDYYSNKINELKNSSSNLNLDDEAENNAKLVNSRFKDKKEQTTNKLDSFNNKITEMEKKINDAEDDIKNIFYEPEYDFSDIELNLSYAKPIYKNASELAQVNKFNTVMALIKSEELVLSKLDTQLNNELNKKRHVKIWVWVAITLFIFIIIITLFLSIIKPTKNKPRT